MINLFNNDFNHIPVSDEQGQLPGQLSGQLPPLAPLLEITTISNNDLSAFNDWYATSLEGQQFPYEGLSNTEKKRTLCRWRGEERRKATEQKRQDEQARIESNRQRRQRVKEEGEDKHDATLDFIECEGARDEEEINKAFEQCMTHDLSPELIKIEIDELESRLGDPGVKEPGVKDPGVKDAGVEETVKKAKIEEMKAKYNWRLRNWSDKTSAQYFRADNPGENIMEYYTYLIQVTAQLHRSSYIWDTHNTIEDTWYQEPASGIPFNTKGKCLDSPFAYVKGEKEGIILIINNEKYYNYLIFRQRIHVYDMMDFFPYCMENDLPIGNFANSFKRYKYMPSPNLKANSKKYTEDQIEALCNDYQGNFFLWVWYRLFRRNKSVLFWKLSWAARKIKYPRERMDRMINLIGNQGGGKTVFLQTIFGGLMGSQFYRQFSKFSDLLEHFNGDWAPNNLICVLDDFKYFWSKETQDILTPLISQPLNNVKHKFGLQFFVKNYRLYCSTSNPNRKAINDDDCVTQRRRNVTVKISDYFCGRSTWWKDEYLEKHAENPEEMQKLIDFLYELDVSEFNAGQDKEWMKEGALDKMFEGEDYMPLRFLASIVKDDVQVPTKDGHASHRYLEDLHEAYKVYCVDAQVQCIKKKQFHDFLKDQGIKIFSTNHNKKYYDITKENVERAIRTFINIETYTCENLLEGAQQIVSEKGKFVEEMKAMNFDGMPSFLNVNEAVHA